MSSLRTLLPARARGAAAAAAAAGRSLTTVSHERPRCMALVAAAAAAARRQQYSCLSSVATAQARPSQYRGGNVVAAYGRSLRTGMLEEHPHPHPQSPYYSHPRTQPFSSTSRRRATIVTQNVRQDEEGNDMLIDITDRAQKRLREIASKDKNPELALRVTVQSGGCHGFQYLMSLTSLKDVSLEDDTVFETAEKDARVVMDEPSLELLKGSKVDFTMELIGSQFKITGNPAATSSCGCGTSFDVKI